MDTVMTGMAGLEEETKPFSLFGTCKVCVGLGLNSSVASDVCLKPSNTSCARGLVSGRMSQQAVMVLAQGQPGAISKGVRRPSLPATIQTSDVFFRTSFDTESLLSSLGAMRVDVDGVMEERERRWEPFNAASRSRNLVFNGCCCAANFPDTE